LSPPVGPAARSRRDSPSPPPRRQSRSPSPFPRRGSSIHPSAWSGRAASRLHLRSARRFNPHEGVVIRHLALGIDDAAANQDVPLGPVDLNIPWADRGDSDAPPVRPDVV